ncbi:hypothetical protein OH77DRAFT_1419173 [Trametes cingulata]|nr:hypothetical protein OH77DRAFT_1419173 [Trametes cingulata]
MLSCRPHTKHLSKLKLVRSAAKRRCYSNKVRAFPFAISREQAIADLSFHTALLTGEKVFGSWVRRLLPGLSIGDALLPTRVLPVYLPTWIIDGEAKVTVWAKKQVSDDHFVKDTAQVQFGQSDMPGFVYTPLSNLSFVSPRLLEAPTVPWSEDLRKHDGEDVLCLPFSLSPFKLPDAARSLSMAESSIANVLRFEPSSLKETMLAGYPVLVPGYVAQYEIENVALMPGGSQGSETVSAFIEAGVPRGRAVVEVTSLISAFLDMLNLPVGNFFIRGEYAELARRFANVQSFIGNHTVLKHSSLIEAWINRAVVQGGAVERYRNHFFGTSDQAAARNVDWSDVRIRPFDLDERQANASWLKSGANLYLLQTMLQVYNSKRESAPPTADAASLVPSDSDVQWVKTQIATVEKEREETKPAWIHEYEIQQRLLSPHDGSAAQEARPAERDAVTDVDKPAQVDRLSEANLSADEGKQTEEGRSVAEDTPVEGKRPAEAERPAEDDRSGEGVKRADGGKPSEGDKP